MFCYLEVPSDMVATGVVQCVMTVEKPVWIVTQVHDTLWKSVVH